jgi:hypothetical protein
MRELERDDLPSPLSAATLVVVGRGRAGRSLIAGSTADSLAHAGSLAEALGMRPFEVEEEHRPAYDALAERAEAVAGESGDRVSA